MLQRKHFWLMDSHHPQPAALLRRVRNPSPSRDSCVGEESSGLLGDIPAYPRIIPTKLPVQNAAGWKELGQTWSSSLDDVVENMRKSLRLAPSVFALVLALTLMFASSASDPESLSRMLTVFDGKVGGGQRTLAVSRFDVDDRGRAISLKTAKSEGDDAPPHAPPPPEHKDYDYPGGQRVWDNEVKEIGAVYRKFDAIQANSSRLGEVSAVRKRYGMLAKLYMKPFRTIQRTSYMDLLEGKGTRGNEACAGCFLIQVKNGELYVYDPKQVRSMAEFREIRMREAIYWTTRAVQSGAVDNTEFVVSTTDGVVSTSHPHTYRMPAFDKVAHPIFTMTHCNCSENIPFPMTFTDLLRRGFKEKFWKARSGSIAQWDQMSTDVLGAQTHESHVWAKKRRQGVFRGAIRIPASLPEAEDYDKHCELYGRTALEAKAQQDRELMERQQRLWRRKHWVWDSLGKLQTKTGFGQGKKIKGRKSEYGAGDGRLGSKSFLPLLDVKISGKCGNRTYVSDNLDMEQQSQYRYTVHAEGNGFWADRLAIQLFGSSSIIKQLTPCGMFFEPLLRAYEHYIPVDYWFRDILQQVKWARGNDEPVHEMVRNARNFAGDYLTVSGIAAYAEEILKEYTKRLAASGKEGKGAVIQIHPHAIKLFPV